MTVRVPEKLLPFVSQDEWETKQAEVSSVRGNSGKYRWLLNVGMVLIIGVCLGVGINIIRTGAQISMQEHFECTQPDVGYDGCAYSCCGSEDCGGWGEDSCSDDVPAGNPENCVYYNNQAQGSKFYPSRDAGGKGTDGGKSCKCQNRDNGYEGCGVMNTDSRGTYEFHERKNHGYVQTGLAVILFGCTIGSYLVWLAYCHMVAQEISIILGSWTTDKGLEVKCFTLRIALLASTPQVWIDTKRGIQRRDYAPSVVAAGVQVPITPMAVAQGSIAVPVATPIPASIQQVVPVQPQTEQMQLIVPQGSGPGSVINVQAPCGRQVQVTVPAGYMPGMPMVVQI